MPLTASADVEARGRCAPPRCRWRARARRRSRAPSAISRCARPARRAPGPSCARNHFIGAPSVVRSRSGRREQRALRRVFDVRARAAVAVEHRHAGAHGVVAPRARRAPCAARRVRSAAQVHRLRRDQQLRSPRDSAGRRRIVAVLATHVGGHRRVVLDALGHRQEVEARRVGGMTDPVAAARSASSGSWRTPSAPDRGA